MVSDLGMRQNGMTLVELADLLFKLKQFFEQNFKGQAACILRFLFVSIISLNLFLFIVCKKILLFL